MLRLHRINEVPFALHQFEAANGVNALEVLQGKHAVYFPESGGREGLYAYAVAFAVSILGRTNLAVRLPAALASATTVFAVFWLGWLLFKHDEKGTTTRWRGLFVGAVSAGLLATSMSQTIIGRTAFRGKLSATASFPLSSTALVGLEPKELVAHCAGRRVRRVAGIHLRCGAFHAPLLFLIFGLSFLPPRVRNKRKGVGNDGRAPQHNVAPSTSIIRAAFPWVAMFVCTAGIVAAPILAYYNQHPQSFWGPGSIFTCGGSTIADGPLYNPLRAFVRNLWFYLFTFGFRGDPSWSFNLAGQPLLNPLEAVFFWFGVGTAVYHWRSRPACRLLLLWLGLLLLPAMLVEFYDEPFTPRMIGSVPAAYLLTGVGMWEMFRVLRVRSHNLTSPVFRIFRENETWLTPVLGMVVGGLILILGAHTYRTYFQEWAAAPAVRRVSDDALLGELAQELNTQPSNTGMVYLLPGNIWRGDLSWNCTFRFFYQGDASGYGLPVDDSRLPQKIKSRLAAAENVSVVKVVEWDSDSAGIEDDIVTFDFLLRKYGRYAGSDEMEGFRVHNYTDITLQLPWTFYEQLESPTVHYDGGISLLGIALGLGEEQLSVQQPFELNQDRSLWGVLQWQTTPSLDIDYSTSLRLYNDEGRRVYQKDEPLSSATTYTSDVQWPPGEIFYSLHQLDLPADLLSRLRSASGCLLHRNRTPTVEIGVWEPMKILVHLRLTDAR